MFFLTLNVQSLLLEIADQYHAEDLIDLTHEELIDVLEDSGIIDEKITDAFEGLDKTERIELAWGDYEDAMEDVRCPSYEALIEYTDKLAEDARYEVDFAYKIPMAGDFDITI